MADEEAHAPEGKRDGAGLPRDVQEHLGRRLRTAMQVEEPKPAFLGESSLPPEFDRIVRRLEAGERGERQGYEAVKAALSDLNEVPDGESGPR